MPFYYECSIHLCPFLSFFVVAMIVLIGSGVADISVDLCANISPLSSEVLSVSVCLSVCLCLSCSLYECSSIKLHLLVRVYMYINDAL